MSRSDGEYVEEAAADLLRYRARKGDRNAQYQLGVYYESVKRPEAGDWVCRAANSGYAPAQLHMGHWYSEDRYSSDPWPFIRISPDDRDAYLWYSLAESNGEPIASVFRESIERERLSSDEIAEARTRVDHWQPETCGSAGGR